MKTRWITTGIAALMLAAQSAVPAIAATPTAAGECLQTSRGNVYSTMTNDRYRCEVDGNRLLVIDMGRKVAAPEGMYRNLPDGRKCFVGKGGYILSCSLQ